MSNLSSGQLAPEEEIALRRLASQCIGIEPAMARRLERLALAERFRDGWRLTPLGRRRYRDLPKPPLQESKPLPVIDTILDRAIPLARAARILQPEPASDEDPEPPVRSPR
jgi:hypothetical protein